jgi:triosephosphate isomerase
LNSKWKVSPPLFVVNFKAYVYGLEALRFSREAERISSRYDVPVIVVPQIVDIAKIAKATRLQVFAPHIDPISPGRGTGSVLPEAVKEAGAAGTMLNHAERRLSLEEIGKAIKRADAVGLATMVCADKPEDVPAIVNFAPNIIGTEPPDLIGSGRSVGKVDGNFVRNSVVMVKRINPKIIVGSGAGVVSGKDVAQIIRLGAEMTGATSGILRAPDPVKALDEMVGALKKAWVDRNRRQLKRAS